MHNKLNDLTVDPVNITRRPLRPNELFGSPMANELYEAAALDVDLLAAAGRPGAWRLAILMAVELEVGQRLVQLRPDKGLGQRDDAGVGLEAQAQLGEAGAGRHHDRQVSP